MSILETLRTGIADPDLRAASSEAGHKAYELHRELLLEAHRLGEKVVVHGDYDVDGVTATALLYQGLKWCGFNADWFLPNRFQEGYGISFASVGKLHELGARWIVSVVTGAGPVRYYVYDRTDGCLRFLFTHQPKLERYHLARMEPIVFPARDGVPDLRLIVASR